MIIKAKCIHEYVDAVKSYSIFIDTVLIGDLFCSGKEEEFGRGWHVVLCWNVVRRLGYANAQFATEEGATKYMKLVAYAESHELTSL